MISIQEEVSNIAKAYAAEDPPFEKSVHVSVPEVSFFNVRRVTGGFVVTAENPSGMETNEYVVTSKVKLIKLIKKLLEE